MTECGICGTPAGEDLLCRTHVGELVTELTAVPELLDDVDVTITRQDRMGGASVGRVRGSTDRGVPWNDAASAAARTLSSTVTFWATTLASANPHLAQVLRTAPEMALWLAGLPNLMATLPEAAELFTSVTGATARARIVIDVRPSRQYIGICSATVDGEQCVEELYATEGRTWVRCRACRVSHDVDQRRQVLFDHLEDVLAPAAELVGLLDHLGRHVTSSQIRSWHRRGRLVSHGDDRRGRALFRIGDVLDVANRRYERQAVAVS